MRKSYSIVNQKDSQSIARYFARHGQALLPLVDLIEASRLAVDELIDILGRASIEAVLQLSAQSWAGEKRQGRKGEEILWYGNQSGTVRLSDRKLPVKKPRLRKKGTGKGGEVEIPAYEALNAGGTMSQRLLEILMCNVSTRNYPRVIPEMADTVGVSQSAVSRNFIEAGGQELERLAERRFDQVELLIIYLDGLVFGDYHALCAVGVDVEGGKQVLGIKEGASENGATATALLEDLVARGVKADQRYLFVIDGSKALRAAIHKVFGSKSPVQRCRHHKVRNVCEKLPDDLAEQVNSVMKAAYRMPWQEGIARLKKQAEWLSKEYPDASASLLEGLEETFTINRLELSSSLRLCLGSTNLIESPYSGVRRRTDRVTRWRDGTMVLRWVASSFLEAEKKFRKIQGYRDLWMLKAKLRDDVSSASVKEDSKVA